MPLFQQYMERNQEIVCGNGGAKYSLEHLEALRFFKMKCKECTDGICSVINLSRRYEPILQSIDKELLLPSTELGILQSLHSEMKPLLRPTSLQSSIVRTS